MVPFAFEITTDICMEYSIVYEYIKIPSFTDRLTVDFII